MGRRRRCDGAHWCQPGKTCAPTPAWPPGPTPRPSPAPPSPQHLQVRAPRRGSCGAALLGTAGSPGGAQGAPRPAQRVHCSVSGAHPAGPRRRSPHLVAQRAPPARSTRAGPTGQAAGKPWSCSACALTPSHVAPCASQNMSNDLLRGAWKHGPFSLDNPKACACPPSAPGAALGHVQLPNQPRPPSGPGRSPHVAAAPPRAHAAQCVMLVRHGRGAGRPCVRRWGCASRPPLT